MASNTLLDIFRIKDLRNRILFTLGVLMIYRVGTFIPIPGINVSAIQAALTSQQGTSGGLSITGYLDFFSGGAFSNFSIFMLGIVPYISMSIIMQLMLLVFPALKKIQTEDGGAKKIQRYIRYGTVGVALMQSLIVRQFAASIPNAIATDNRFIFTIFAMLAVTVGTMFLMWLGEQINERGIGNGISLIIFAGIVARMPGAVWSLIVEIRNGLNVVFVLLALIMFVVVVVLVIYEQRGQRKIPVNYAKRVVGRRMYGAQSSYIPFKINPSGVIPVIFASSVLTFPIQIASGLASDVRWLQNLQRFLRPDGMAYIITYTLLIVFFAYFYTQVSLNPIEIARQIRENGGSIPGLRAEKTEEYLMKVLNRIILPGALFLALIAVIPTIVQSLFNFPVQAAFLIGGTSLLILVGVDLDLMSQIEGQLKMHHHDGLTKKGKIRSRNL